MDEAFLTSAFAAMGENIVNVKIMKNKSTGYVRYFLLLFWETFVHHRANEHASIVLCSLALY